MTYHREGPGPKPHRAEAGPATAAPEATAPRAPDATVREQPSPARASAQTLFDAVIAALGENRREAARTGAGLVFGLVCGFALSAALTPKPPAPPAAQTARTPPAAVERPTEPSPQAAMRARPQEGVAPRPGGAPDTYGYPAWPGVGPSAREFPPAGAGEAAPGPGAAPAGEAPGYTSRRPWGATLPRESEMRPREEKETRPASRAPSAPAPVPSPYPYPGWSGLPPWGVDPFLPVPLLDPYAPYPYGAGYW